MLLKVVIIRRELEINRRFTAELYVEANVSSRLVSAANLQIELFYWLRKWTSFTKDGLDLFDACRQTQWYLLDVTR